MTRRRSVLVVDDQAQNLRLMRALLAPEGYEIECVTSGQAALDSCASGPPDLVLLDLMMPGMDGYEVARALKADPRTARTPIIMVSAHDDREARLRGLQSGAEDFLTKPVDRAELWLRVRNLMRLKDLTDALQEQSDALEEQVRARTAALQHQASYDALTGLPNRTLFYDTLDRSLGLAASRGWSVAVLFIDLDHFKTVNDTLGHAVGDLLLQQVADRLVGCARIRDTVGRQGGDEFALILLLESGRSGAAAVAAKVHEVMRAPFDLAGHEVSMTASVGITVFPEDAQDPDTLMKYADTAMYRAKRAGRDTFRFFTAEMNAEVTEQLELEIALRTAVQQQEFVLHYQPKLELSSGRIVGMEALLRWERPGHGLVSPATFIPALERSGLIVRVGGWVIDTVCQQIAQWRRDGLPPMQVSVNVASRQFVEGDLVGDVLRSLREHDVPACALELELTESMLMENTDRTIETLQALRRTGVQVSVDDFGTGYSSLAYLRRFPIDKLKIDVAFVRDITCEPDEAAIALAIIRMAHSLKLDVVAEGVETAAQLSYLRHHRCDQVQGYHISRPLPADAVARFVRETAGLPAWHEPGSEPDTLLVVEGDPAQARSLETALSRQGYRVLWAATHAEAFEQLALHAVHVVLCGQTWGPVSGPDFLDSVKELHPSVLRALLSPDLSPDAVRTAVNRGSLHRYWSASFDPEVLRADLREAFRERLTRDGQRPTDADCPADTARPTPSTRTAGARRTRVAAG